MAVSVSIHVHLDGSLDGAPQPSPSPRVYVEGAHPKGFAVSKSGLRALRDHETRREFISAATDFREFLNHWTFVSEGGLPTQLGASLWPSQEIYVNAVE